MARPSKIEEKREEILAAARTEFGKFGYQKTTLDDVANAMGLKKASLYHYFKNKEDLFFAVILDIANVSIPELFEKAKELPSVKDTLAFYFGERLHFYIEMLRSNALGREALVNLQNRFDSVYAPALLLEKKFVAQIFSSLNSKKSEKELEKTTNYLFMVIDAMKHDAIYKGQLLDEKPEEVAQVKELINQTLDLIIEHISNN
jgi:AcrR family transcriptional regulator